MALKELLSFALAQSFGHWGKEGCKVTPVGKINEEIAADTGKHSYNGGGFQMPVHYPRYTRGEYEEMEEWKVDKLLKDYGTSFKGSLHEKRKFAIGAFVWE